MTATNNDDQLGKIYQTMLNELNCTFGVSFARFHRCDHGLWPSWFMGPWPSRHHDSKHETQYYDYHVISNNEVGQHGVEGGGKVDERRTVSGAVGEAAVDEPPEIGRTAGRGDEPCRHGTQLTLTDHVVVGQTTQRQVAEREHLPDVDAEREDVGRRREGTVDRVPGGEVDVDRGGGEQLGRGPADGDEALPQWDVLGGVYVAAERREAELDVQRRRQKDVTGGHVAVDETQVGGEVVKSGSYLITECQLLYHVERWQTN